MSLQVWLPLNGNLNNQGLDTITISGTPTYGPGKLAAQAYNLKNRCTFTVPSLVGVKTWSVAFWYITNTDTSLSSNWVDVLGFTDQKSDNSATGQYRFETCYGSVTNDGISQHDNGTYATHNGFNCLVTTFGTWHHICTTIDYENNICVAYVDGVRVRNTTHNGGHLTGYVWLGEANQVNGYLQDLRLYDHALSAKEVKEISKGLILHLPLDNNGAGNENLLIESLKDRNQTHATYEICDFNFSKALVANKTYTVSCKINMSPERKSIGLHHSGGSYNMGPWLAKNDTGFYRWTFTATSQMASQTTGNGYGFARMYVSNVNGPQGSVALTGTANVDWIKIEEGEVATPWCPNTADALYSSLGFNSSTVYDTSGYRNNGTMWAYDSGGSIETSSDTKRYSGSTYINSNNNTTNTASGTRYIYGNCPLTTPNYLTVAFWCKPIAGYNGAVTQGQFSLTNNNIGADAGYDYQTAPFNHRDSIIDVNGSNGSTHKTVAIGFTANEWHHYAVVYDGRYGRVYKDGVQTATCDMGSNMALGSMKGAVIGFSKAGGVWRSNKSYYSDFRIYATALSAADVEELYKVSASVDNGNSLHCYSLVEE